MSRPASAPRSAPGRAARGRAHGRRLAAAVMALLGGLAPATATAGGPWKGQILDGETGRPLEGVVVVFYWITHTATLAGWAGGEFHDAHEVVTGPDGAFLIPARRTSSLVPWKKVSREVVIFKSGYGLWRFQGYEQWPGLPQRERQARLEAAWRQLEGAGARITLPPLRTRKERLELLDFVSIHPLLPRDRAGRLEAAIAGERERLGLPGM